ncbi:CHAP domain-containing protein [Sphaerisporangium sp. TRM90804]|nr:CHAP domain-containing protein [Sphaerisporangium sp. TRM90804]MDH2430707.1 CHAP domain-containing protein [Sphaerisporangium sp. TRM90804]
MNQILKRLATGLGASALLLAGLAATTTQSATAATTRSQIVAVAQAELGDSARNVERPAGSNCNFYTGVFRTWIPASGCGTGDGVQFRKSEWCADFAKYVWKNAGVTHADVAEGDGGVLTGWAASFKEYGTEHGTWHTRAGGYAPQPGDAIVFDWDQSGDIDHVGIVTSSDGSTVYTIEGNSGDRIKANSYSRSDADIAGYSEPVGATSGPDGHRVQMGDLNGDDLDDLVQVRDNGDVVVFWNNGQNPNYSWQNNRLVLGGITDPSQIRVGDFDGDGLDDLLQIRPNGDVVVFFNQDQNPNFSWQDNRLVLGGITDKGQINVGDFDGDGLDDLVQVRPNGDVVVFFNTGQNPNFSWQDNRLVLGGITDKGQIKAGDFDGDGLDDLVQTRPNGDVVVFFNTGLNPNFSWQNNRLVLGGITDKAQIKTGDVNDDGLDDLVQVRPNGDVVVFFNTGLNPNFSWQNNRLVLGGMYL